MNRPKRDQLYGFAESQETGYTCPICGEDIAWWLEPYGCNADGDICHEKCLERGNFGRRCHETISLQRELLMN